MKLYLTRHADTGLVERAQKPGDDLSEKGFKQAQALAERFTKVELGGIYTSPYQRALSTAKVVVDKFPNLEPQVDERLKEIPLWVSPADLQDDSKEEYNEAKKLLDATQSGVLEFLEEIKARHMDKQVLVVAHGNLIRATVGALLRMPLTSIARLTVNHTSVTTFEWVDDEVLPFYLLHTFNDTGHLNDNHT